MKFKLFLIYTLSLLSVACSDQLSPVQPDPVSATAFYESNSILQNIPLDSTKVEPKRNKRPTIFGDLLVKLNLSADQRRVVDTLLIKHRACTEQCVSILKRAEREILLDAKIKEESIKSKLKSGEITRNVALKQLKELKEQVNAALKSLIVKTKVKECLISCDNEFINSLRRILSTEQLSILNKWSEEKTKRG